MDIGIYCVQGAIYTSGKVPVAVTAVEGKKTNPELFRDVEESISWRLEFEDGTFADGETSYGSQMNLLKAECEKGFFELNPAYQYDGLKGKTSKKDMSFPQVSEQALQMDDFAYCVINNKPTRVPGEMGLRDVKILYAIYEAAHTGKKVMLT